MRILLSKGKYAIIDIADFERIKDYKWSFDGRYAIRCSFDTGKKKKVYMHKHLVDFKIVDHINMNKLDNRKSNLRNTNMSLNSANGVKKSKRNNYKGVYFVPKKQSVNHWETKIMVNRKNIWIGSFPTEEQAVNAHIKASKKYFGDHARSSR